MPIIYRNQIDRCGNYRVFVFYVYVVFTQLLGNVHWSLDGCRNFCTPGRTCWHDVAVLTLIRYNQLLDTTEIVPIHWFIRLLMTTSVKTLNEIFLLIQLKQKIKGK